MRYDLLQGLRLRGEKVFLILDPTSFASARFFFKVLDVTWVPQHKINHFPLKKTLFLTPNPFFSNFFLWWDNGSFHTKDTNCQVESFLSRKKIPTKAVIRNYVQHLLRNRSAPGLISEKSMEWQFFFIPIIDQQNFSFLT